MTRDHSEYVRLIDGADTAVLMVHGIVSTPRHFDFLIPLIPAEWSVCNLLLDGHGGTVADFAHTSMKKWKQQVEDTLRRLCERHRSVLVVGYSMGTLLTMRLVERYPQVKAMLLLNVPLHAYIHPAMVGRCVRFCLGKVKENDPVEQATYRDISVTLTPYLWRYIPWIPRFIELLQLCRDSRAAAARLSVPSRVVFGKKDELVRLRSQRYFDGNAFVRCYVFDHTGHCYYEPAFIEQAKQSFAELIELVEQEKREE